MAQAKTNTERVALCAGDPEAEPQEKQEIAIEAIEEVQVGKNIVVNVLKKAGYETITQVARAHPDTLAKATGLNNGMVRKLILAAREVYDNYQD